MPMDPLDNIMGGLLRKGAIDPAAKQQRMAQATNMRSGMGIQPSAVAPNRKPPQQAQSRGNENVPQQPPMQPSMTDVVVDQLNEAIVTLKMEVGREPSNQRKRNLEQQINKLRTQVRELGGVPVEAHESVQEGIEKLKGYGAVGYESVLQELTASGLATDETAAKLSEWESAGKVPVRSYLEGLGYNVGWSQDQQAVVASQGDKAVKLDQSLFDRMTVDQAGGERTFAQKSFLDQLLAIGDQKAEVRLDDRLSQFDYTQIAPPQIDMWSNVNSTLQQWGYQPQSAEQLYETARLMAERAALSQKQLIQRELSRFEENWPNEFEIAKTKINEQAATMTAELQEDFAARGMYYSSIMSNNIGKIDRSTMEMIADIAKEAATRVANLRDELRGVEQWEILEREVVFRELQAESRKEALAMAQIRANVEIASAQNALAQWTTQVNASVQSRQNELEKIKVEYQMTLEQRDLASTAALAMTNTSLQKMITDQGMWPAFMNMSTEDQGRFIAKTLEYNEMKTKDELYNAQIMALTAEAALSNAQATAVSRQTFATGTEADEDEMWPALMGKIDKNLSALESLANMSARDVQKPENVTKITNLKSQLDVDMKQIQSAAMRNSYMETYRQLVAKLTELQNAPVMGVVDSLLSKFVTGTPSTAGTESYNPPELKDN